MNPSKPESRSLPHLTDHSRLRMAQRGIGAPEVLAAMSYGRTRYLRGARFHVIGRKEVRSAEKRGVDLSGHEGVHVLCSPEGIVLTVYRNRQLDLRDRRLRRYRRVRPLH